MHGTMENVSTATCKMTPPKQFLYGQVGHREKHVLKWSKSGTLPKTLNKNTLIFHACQNGQFGVFCANLPGCVTCAV